MKVQLVCSTQEEYNNNKRKMKVFHFTRTTLAPVVLLPQLIAFAPAPFYQRHAPHKTTLFLKEIMSEMDSMCISNAANLCSHYDQCDVEEREAMLNRFDEQTDLLAERMAVTQSLSRHLRTGNHKFLEDEEVADLKRKIMDSHSLDVSGVETLDDLEVRELHEEIRSAIQREVVTDKNPATVKSYYDSLPLNWVV